MESNRRYHQDGGRFDRRQVADTAVVVVVVVEDGRERFDIDDDDCGQ